MKVNVCDTLICGMEVTGDNVSSVDNKNQIDYLSPKYVKSSSWDDQLAPEMEHSGNFVSIDDMESREATSDDEQDIEVKEEKTPLSYELLQGERILYELMSDANKHFNWPFMDAVDASIPELSDYYERIKSPMWLKKMQEKFDLRQYETITEFVADFRQMLENCFRYNGPDHYVSKRAQRLETMLEQKLALLSRELREKTTIEATSGSSNNSSNTGVRRRGFKSIIPHDSSNLLNQLREEEARRAREVRQNQIAERRAVTEAWLNDLQGWEDDLLAGPYCTHMKAMWELPQIGLFLFLCQTPLNLLEVTQFELERCFAMVKQSSTLRWTMTSLLSTPFQRTKIDKKALMPYSVWNEKLMARMSIWYKALDDAKGDVYVASSKLGIDTFFFDVVGKKNPLLKKKFHELSFYRKVWIMKTLCDHCLEVQESLRDAIEFQPLADQHEYVLGWDAKGNSYLHFPQFCGADVRIYRQAPLPEPDEEDLVETKTKDTSKEDYVPPVKKKKKSTGNFGRRKRPSQVKKVKKPVQEDECTDMDETAVTGAVCTTSHSRAEKKGESISMDETGVSSITRSRSRTAASEVNEVDSDTLSLSSNRSARFSRRKSHPRSRLARKLKKQFDTIEDVEDHSQIENDVSDASPSKSFTEKNFKTSVISDIGNSNDEVSCRYSHASGTANVNNGDSESRKDRSANECEDIRHNCFQREMTSEERDNGENEHSVTECKKMDCSSGTVLESSGSRKITSRGGKDCDTNLTSQISQNVHTLETDTSLSLIESNKKSCDVSSEEAKKSCTLKKQKSASPNSTNNTSRIEKHSKSSSIGNSLSNNSNVREIVTSEAKYKLAQDKTTGTSLPNSECLSKPDLSNLKDGNVKTKMCNVKVENKSCNDELSKPSVNSNGEGLQEGVTERTIKLEMDDVDEITVNGNVSDNVKKEYVLKSNDGIQKVMKQECETVSNGEVRHAVKLEYESELSEDKTNLLKEEYPTDTDEKGDSKDLKKENNCEPDKEENKLKQDAVTETNTEESEDEEEALVPTVGEFELVVENVQQLREMCEKFAEPDPVSVRKGRKVIKPPPRKRCVIELHERLLFLLNELEPWETKLCQATRRARVKMRKEYESYKEEEPQEDLKNWDTDRSDEGSSDSDDNDSSEDSEEETKERKSPRKSTTLPQKIPETPVSEDYEFDVSSRGRLRKRRVIPNNTEDQFCKKRKVIKVSEGSLPPANMPNILMKQKQTTSVGNVVPSSGFQTSTQTVLTSNFASASQLLRMSMVNPTKGKHILSSTTIKGQRFQLLGNTSVTQNSHPVIQSLLSLKKSTAAMTGEAAFKKLQVKGENNSLIASVIQSIAPGSMNTSLDAPIHIVAKPSTTPQKTLQLSTLPTGVLQQLLKNKAMRIQTAGGATTILLTAPVKQISSTIQQGLQQQSSETASSVQNEHLNLSVQCCQSNINLSANNLSSTTAMDGDAGHHQVTSPTSSCPNTVPLSNFFGSSTAANNLGMLTTSLPMLSPSKQRYANNITVKELLETRVAHGKGPAEGSASPIVTQTKLSDIISDGQNIDTDVSRATSIPSTGQLSFVVNPKQQSMIDTAIQSVMTSVSTSLPTVNIKVPSPVTLPSINLRKNVTKTIQVMKSPIAVTPKLESLVSSPSAGTVVNAPLSGQTVIPTPSALGSQMSLLVQGAMRAAATAASKNVIVKGSPQTVISSQGVLQAYLTPQGLIIPASQMSVQAGPKVTSAKPVQCAISPQQVNISSPEAVSKGFFVQALGNKPGVSTQTTFSSQIKKSEVVVSSVPESVLQSPLASPAVMQSLSAALKLKSQSQTNKNIMSVNSMPVASQKVNTVTSPDGKKITLTNVNLGQLQKAGVPDNNMAAILTGLSSKVASGTPAAELMKQIVAGQQGQMANIVLNTSPNKQNVMVSGDSKQLGLKVEKVEQPSMIPAVIFNQPGVIGATQKKIVLPLQNLRPTMLQGGLIGSMSTSITSPPAAQNVISSAVRQIFPSDAQPQVTAQGIPVTSPVKFSTVPMSMNKVNKLLLPSGQQIQQLLPGQKPVLLTAQNVQLSPVQQGSLKPGVVSKGQVLLPQKDGAVQPTRLVLSPQLVTGQIAQLPVGKLAVPQSPVQKVIYNLPQNTILQQGMTSVTQSPLNIVGVSQSPSLPNASVRFLFPSFATVPASVNQNLQPVFTVASQAKPQTVSSSSGIIGANQLKQGPPDTKPQQKLPNAKANHPALASALFQTTQFPQPVKTELNVSSVQTGMIRCSTVLPECSNVCIPSMKISGKPELSLNTKQIENMTPKDSVQASPFGTAPAVGHGLPKLDTLHMQLPTVSGNPTVNNAENNFLSVSDIPNLTATATLQNTGFASDSSANKHQKLMLFNIGGQLMTAQGVPVTVHQGVLKVLPQATIQVGSQVLTVRAPSSSLVQTVPQVKTTSAVNYPPSCGIQMPQPVHTGSSTAVVNHDFAVNTSVQKLGDTSKNITQMIHNLHGVKTDDNLNIGQPQLNFLLPEPIRSSNLEGGTQPVVVETVSNMPSPPPKVMTQELSSTNNNTPKQVMLTTKQKQTTVPSPLKCSLGIDDGSKIPYQPSASTVDLGLYKCPTKTSISCTTVHQKTVLASSGGLSFHVSPTSKVKSLADLNTNNISEKQQTVMGPGESTVGLKSSQKPAPNTPTKSREEAALNLLSLAAVGTQNKNQF